MDSMSSRDTSPMVALGGKALKALGVGLVGGVILWEAAVHGGRIDGMATIHVPGAPAAVEIDGRVVLVQAAWKSPLVCRLGRGRHVLRLRRGGRVVDEQDFALCGGDQVVLTTWDHGRRREAESLVAQAAPTPSPRD